MQFFLLFLMLLLELIAAFCRWAFPAVCIGILLGLTGEVGFAHDPQLLSQVVAWGFAFLYAGFYLHIGLVILRLLAPAWERFRLGLRKPSERERLQVEVAYDMLEDLAKWTSSMKIKHPRTFLVRDTSEMQVRFMGMKLVIDRPLILSYHTLLPPLLAHELGHYNSSDRITRFLLLFFPPWFCAPGCFIGLALGFGALLTAPIWRIYWRNREYAADQFAVQCDLGPELADFLETYLLPLDRSSAMAKLFRKEPYIEERLDRLP